MERSPESPRARKPKLTILKFTRPTRLSWGMRPLRFLGVRGIVPVTGIKRMVSVITGHKVVSFGNDPFLTRFHVADTVICLEDITLTGSVGICLVLSSKTIFFNLVSVLFTVYREDFLFVVCDGIARIPNTRLT